jgi:murein L,D-transpeptidase YafK
MDTDNNDAPVKTTSVFLQMPSQKRLSILAGALGFFLALSGFFFYVPVHGNTLATRTIWYLNAKGKLADSTAQKAAVARLKSVTPSNISFPLPDVRILVKKQSRELTLFSGDTPIKTYRIALGGHPAGTKETKGDGRTPSGDYYICTRQSGSRYHLFLGLNYPNAQDAQKGLQANRIDEAACKEMAQAEQDHKQPSWTTAMGGAIGIHGRGSRRDWTLGCIALEDSDVEEIWAATQHWTPVRIEE